LLTPPLPGNGRGPINQRSRQVYELAKLTLTGQYVPIIGPGKARWHHVHVNDLADLYVLLIEAAVAGNTDAELWGAKGYIFPDGGEHVWGDLSRTMGQKAVELGYLKEAKEKSLEKDAAIEQAGFEAVSWGWNSRSKGERASKVLGWKPTRPSIEEEVPEILKKEHARLQK
jgi:nucleoside-diphosphate-sugar epimerase